MKKFFILIVLIGVLFSCQNEDRKDLVEEPEEAKLVDSIPVLIGEFVYVADAAVLRGADFVYGVELDSMSQALADRVQPYKSEAFDMVSVKVRGKIKPNVAREGWEEVIEIKEIIEILEDQKILDTIKKTEKK